MEEIFFGGDFGENVFDGVMYCSFEVGKGIGGRELQVEVVYFVGKESEEFCVYGLVFFWKKGIYNGCYLVVSYDVDGEDLVEQVGVGVEGFIVEEGFGGSKVLKVVCCCKCKYFVVLEDVIQQKEWLFCFCFCLFFFQFDVCCSFWKWWCLFFVGFVE